MSLVMKYIRRTTNKFGWQIYWIRKRNIKKIFMNFTINGKNGEGDFWNLNHVFQMLNLLYVVSATRSVQKLGLKKFQVSYHPSLLGKQMVKSKTQLRGKIWSIKIHSQSLTFIRKLYWRQNRLCLTNWRQSLWKPSKQVSLFINLNLDKRRN